MLENAYYSVISPEGCATILFKDAAAAPRAAAALRITAPTCCGSGSMDAVVPEPEAGAHTDHSATAANLKTALVDEPARAAAALARRAAGQRRYDRFRRFGAPGRPAGSSADRGGRMS